MRSIARYSLMQRGASQALHYAAGLRNCFQMLAENPGIGRGCDSVSPGLRRHEAGKHVVFYRLQPGGVRVVRVLHQQMLPGKSQFEP
jgi:toxin ParE1/3/4